MVPKSLKGKEFETLIIDAAKREERSGVLTLCRYGVQGVTFGGKTILVPSLPDFEGVIQGGRQFIIEAKCCQGSSFGLNDDKFKGRQYAHMKQRSAFGVSCFLLIHFAERQLVNRFDPGMTVAVPVNGTMPFWKAYEAGSQLSLSRDMALTIGKIVPWVIPKGCRKALPDLLCFLRPSSSASPSPAFTLETE